MRALPLTFLLAACDTTHVIGTGAWFAGAVDYPVATGPIAVAAADLDRDGARDLVVAGFDGRGLDLLRGRGDGRFHVATPLLRDEPGGPKALAAADLDRDGALDLAVALGSGNEVRVLLGRGDGTFRDGGAFRAGAGPHAVIATDLDGDALLDLAVTNYSDGSVAVLAGRGDGTFAPPTQHKAALQPWGLAVADLDGDGRTDLVAAGSASHDVAVLLATGPGAFAPAQRHPAGRAPFAIAIGDLDGDRDLDLAVCDADGETREGIHLLAGDGRGGFAPAVSIARGRAFTWLVADDFTGDGALDLVAADWLGEALVLLRGRGDGTFRAPITLQSLYGPFSVAAADLDGDRKTDLIAANRYSNSRASLGAAISVLINTSH